MEQRNARRCHICNGRFMSIATIGAIALVETKRLFRARIALTMLLFVPVFQIILFGYAIRPGDARIHIVVAGPTPEGVRSVINTLRKSAPSAMVELAGLPGSADKAVRNGGATIGIEVPPIPSMADPTAFGRPVRVIVDTTDPLLTSTAVAQIERAYLAERLALSDMADAGPRLKIERLFNPDLRSAWTYTPALSGVTVMIAMVMLGCIGIAREREGGSWEAIRSLPILPLTLIIGKVAPHIAIGSLQGALVLLIGHLLFALPLPGAAIAIVLILPIFAAAHYLIGLVISSLATTQLAALQGAIAFYLPAMLLSGFLYPFETLPRWAQTIGNIFPLSHYIRATHDSVLRGRSIGETLNHAVPIIIFLFAILVLATLTLRRETSDL
jgi:ABC-2 type transport system permease protein